MTLLIITNKTSSEDGDKNWIADNWKKALLKNQPNLDLRIWPNTGDKNDITFVLLWHYPDGELLTYPNIKCIASLGAGVDHIVKDSKLPNDVPIVRLVDPYMAVEMKQYVVAAVLHHIKRFSVWEQAQRNHTWGQKPPFSLHDARVGVMGLGHLGTACAAALRDMGLRTHGWSRTPKTIDGVQCFSGDAELNQFLAQSNVLVNLLPLTKRTTGILNTNTFKKLPRDAYVINVARGKHIVDQDLLGALECGHLSGACLDVFQQEPLPLDHPFWTHPKIRITPHISSVTSAKTGAAQVLENYQRCEAGETLMNVVDVNNGY